MLIYYAQIIELSLGISIYNYSFHMGPLVFLSEGCVCYIHVLMWCYSDVLLKSENKSECQMPALLRLNMFLCYFLGWCYEVFVGFLKIFLLINDLIF